MEGGDGHIGHWARVLTAMGLDADGLAHPLDAASCQRDRVEQDERDEPPSP